MLFNSFSFFAFLAVVLIVSRCRFPWSVHKGLLLIMSYLFYAAWNPPFVVLLWISTVADWFFAKWNLVTLLFPLTVFIMGAFCLFIGNFVFVYAAALGSFKRGYFDLVGYALLTPFYWALMSIGAWKGCLQLLFNPYYWEKTSHGLFKESTGDSNQGTGV